MKLSIISMVIGGTAWTQALAIAKPAVTGSMSPANLFARQELPICETSGASPLLADAQEGVKQFDRLGTRTCATGNGCTRMYNYKSAGFDICGTNGGGGVYCQDLTYPFNRIIFACNKDGKVGGQQGVQNNLKVQIVHV